MADTVETRRERVPGTSRLTSVTADCRPAPHGTGATLPSPAAPPVLVAATLEDFLNTRFSESIAGVLAAVLVPALRILLILVVAAVILRLARAAIARIATEIRDPSDGASARFRRKVGISGDASDAAESLRREQRADSLSGLARSVVTVVIWTIVVVMIFGEVGFELGPLIAGAGILGVALGFGAQDLVKDFLSGVFMLAEDQYGVGDIIDVGEAIGVVEGVSLRSTRVRDVTGTLWHVPNGEIARVGNMSQEWARALLDVEVAYDTDLDVAMELIGDVAKEMATEPEYAETFLDTPVVWGVQELAANSVMIRLVIKTVPGRQFAVSRELRRRLKRALDTAGIEIPFPQRTMWLRTEHPVSVGDADTPTWSALTPNDSALHQAVQASAQHASRTVEDVDEQAAAIGAEGVEGVEEGARGGTEQGR